MYNFSEFQFGNFGDADTDRGEVIMKQFHDSMVQMYPSYSLSFEELKANYNPAIIEALGLAANSAEMSDSKTATAMWNLAQQGFGKIPSNYNGFFSALQGQAANINWMDAVSYTVKESAGDIVNGLEEVGQTVIDTSKTALQVVNVAKYLVWPALGLILWQAWKNKEQVGSSMLSGTMGIAGAATKRATKFIAGNPRRRRAKRRRK